MFDGHGLRCAHHHDSHYEHGWNFPRRYLHRLNSAYCCVADYFRVRKGRQGAVRGKPLLSAAMKEAWAAPPPHLRNGEEKEKSRRIGEDVAAFKM
jgi:hypothetical protein